MVLRTTGRHKGYRSSGRCGRLLGVGRLIVNNAMTVNGAFEAPVPEPGGWLVLDPDSQQASLEKWQAADAMVMGRKTYEGLATVWPQMADLPGFEAYAQQMNSMPKYVASRTLSAPLTWNATLLEGDLADSVRALKARARGQPDRHRRRRAGPRPHDRRTSSTRSGSR